MSCDIKEWHTDVVGNRISSWTTKEVDPSGISVRIGIEW